MYIWFVQICTQAPLLQQPKYAGGLFAFLTIYNDDEDGGIGQFRETKVQTTHPPPATHLQLTAKYMLVTPYITIKMLASVSLVKQK